MIKSLMQLLKFVLLHPLNKKKKLATLMRVIKWQLVSRVFEYPIALPFVNQTFLLTTKGMESATANYYCGLQEYEEMSFVIHFLEENDLFIDVGANIGAYSILANSCCKNIKTIAFEPIPSTFEFLIKNIRFNNLNIDAKNIGLSDKKGSLCFTTNLSSCNHVLSKGEKNSSNIDVKVDRLDNILTSQIPQLIKIDVEGYEFKVISGMGKILDNPKLLAIILELNNNGINYGMETHETHKYLLDKGFSSYFYEPSSKRLITLNKKFNLNSDNIYIKNLNEVINRLSKEKKNFLNFGQRI